VLPPVRPKKASWMKQAQPTSLDTQTHTPPSFTSDDKPSELGAGLTGSCAKRGLPATMLDELRKSCDSRPIFLRHDDWPQSRLSAASITASAGRNRV